MFSGIHLSKVLGWSILVYIFGDRFLLEASIILLICLLFPIKFAPIGDFVLRDIKRNIEHIDAEFEKFLSEKCERANMTGEDIVKLPNGNDLRN